MGILSNFFKKTPAPSQKERREPHFASASTSSRQEDSRISSEQIEAEVENEPAGYPQNTPGKAISLGGFKRKGASSSPTPQKNITATPPVTDVRATARKILAVKAAAIPDKQVTVELEEILPQIPEASLKDGKTHVGKTIGLNTYELLPTLSQGRAVISLARLIELAPEFFTESRAAGEIEIKLPLKKIVEQIGEFPGRPDQVEEQYSPLPPEYLNLILQKGVAPISASERQAQAITPSPDVPEIQETKPAPVFATPVVVLPTIEKEGEAVAPSELVSGDEKVSYSLRVLLQNAPKSWFASEVGAVDAATRIAVPFHIVETQLALGRVELPFPVFHDALPEVLKKHFAAASDEAKTAKLEIPLSEIFLNIPGVEPLPPVQQLPTIDAGEESEAGMAEAPLVETPVAAIPSPEASAPIPEPAAVKDDQETVPEPLPANPQPTVPVADVPVIQTVTEPVVEIPPPTPMEPVSHKPEAAQTEPVTVEPPSEPPTADPPPPSPAPVAPVVVPPLPQFQRLAPPPIQLRPTTTAPVESELDKALHGPGLPVSTAAVKNLITTEGKLDQEKAAQHIARLSGVNAVALELASESRNAGEIPQGFNAGEISKAATLLFQSLEAGAPALGARDVTLHHGHFSSTWFKQGEVLLGIVHPQRTMEGSLHEKLKYLTEEIARLR